MHPLRFFKYCPVCGSPEFADFETRAKRCGRCGFLFYLNPAAAVAAFVFNSDGELLLCRRKFEPYKGTLDLPGGFVEFDEDAECAVKREVREELGIDGIDVEYLFSVPNVYPFSNLDVRTLDLFFACKLTKQQVLSLRAADDVESFVFLKLEDVCLDDIGLPSIKKAVEKYRVSHC